MAKQHTKFLLTEGKEDVYAVAGLMSRHVRWGDTENDWPVKIEAAGSIGELLDPTYLGVWFKRSGLEAVGLLLDADDSLLGRWARVRSLCSNAFPGLPEDLPQEGLVSQATSKLRLGVWIMPDNRSSGMLETFLKYLVPQNTEQVWQHAMTATGEASSRGAAFRAVHRDKAEMHAWLAWQDPPGQPLGLALKAKCLDAGSPGARPFSQWFLKLFQLRGS